MDDSPIIEFINKKGETELFSFPQSPASGKRQVCSIKLFDIDTTNALVNANALVNTKAWEDAYEQTMDEKYKKGTRRFGTSVTGKRWDGKGDPPIYLIPRERGGPSYKAVKLEFNEPDDIFFAPISKGFPMQDLSSFTLGPVVGEGLCVVNAAFSKCIYPFHIEGGCVDLSRKNFWKSPRTGREARKVEHFEGSFYRIDDETIDINDWLDSNREVWFEEYDKWRKCVALCSMGDFHWGGTGGTGRSPQPPLAYYVDGRFVDFVTWKREAYIRPAYDLIPKTKVYRYLMNIWKKNGIPLGLVHPKARSRHAEKAITKKFIKELYESEEEMACMPYVVAGFMLEVGLDSSNGSSGDEDDSGEDEPSEDAKLKRYINEKWGPNGCSKLRAKIEWEGLEYFYHNYTTVPVSFKKLREFSYSDPCYCGNGCDPY